MAIFITCATGWWLSQSENWLVGFPYLWLPAPMTFFIVSIVDWVCDEFVRDIFNSFGPRAGFYVCWSLAAPEN